MAHQALYRKWRPSDFGSVVGQEQVTSVLRYQVKTGTTSHAYLFCGSRGTGKTTCAKILSKAVNCLAPEDGNPCGKCEACRAIDSETATDVIEMDAASNNGVDYIRDIREAVVYTPAMLKNRVYIIDEVHMLSVSAFNALLKTLEEPPAQVIFILATTELAKIPPTILSRCQRFDFRRITVPVITDRLSHIASEEGFDFERGALTLIARLAQGGMRDAISMLELCAGSGRRVTERDVLETAGVCGREALVAVVNAVLDRDYDTVFETVRDLYTSSRDIGVFLADLIAFYRDMLVCRATREPEKYIELPDADMDQLRAAASRFTREKLVYHSRVLDRAYVSMTRGGADKRLICETALLSLCDEKLDDRTPALLSRIADLEAALAGYEGAPVRTAPPAPVKESAEDREMPAKAPDVPASAPETPAKAPDASSPGEPIPDFIEAVNRVKAADPTASSMMAMAKAYRTPTGGVLLTVTNDFYCTMLRREQAKALILQALSSLESFGGKTPTGFEVKTVQNDDRSAPAELDF